MVKRLDAYVRAWTGTKWVSCHVNDLTEESFRDFVMEKLCRDIGVVVGVKSDEDLMYRVKPSRWPYYEQEEKADGEVAETR